MRLRQFLNAAYSILHEEYQRWGMNLFDATEALKEYAEGFDPGPAPLAVPASGSSGVVAVQNTKAMEELNKMLGGVK